MIIHYINYHYYQFSLDYYYIVIIINIYHQYHCPNLYYY